MYTDITFEVVTGHEGMLKRIISGEMEKHGFPSWPVATACVHVGCKGRSVACPLL